MTSDKKWEPDTKEMIRTIIRTSISSSTSLKPEDFPHLVRSRLEGQITGATDVDDYIKSILAEMKKNGEI